VAYPLYSAASVQENVSKSPCVTSRQDIFPAGVRIPFKKANTGVIGKLALHVWATQGRIDRMINRICYDGKVPQFNF